MDSREIRLTVNGQERHANASTRTTLADFLREQLELTGTHIGCEHGVCGSCTVLLDGEAVRSCLMLAVQANNHAVKTIEGLAQNGELCGLQKSFENQHGLQCGFCTPGFLMTATDFLDSNPHPTEQEVRSALSGNLCRCTGYKGIVEAVLEASREEGSTTTAAGAPSGEGMPTGAEIMGAALHRFEDHRLLRGIGVYTSDITLPNLAHAALLRSPHARARLVRINAEAARKAPGVVAVLTFADIAANAKPFPQVQPHKSLTSRLPFALVRDVVCYAGEPVAIVVAENAYEAEDALALIEVEYEPLPAAVDAEAALHESATRVHEDLPDNVAGRFGQEVGDVEKALAGAHLVVK
jgi:carbon-monoxide dehydrogenase large subunit